jgi:hypothetical protein
MLGKTKGLYHHRGVLNGWMCLGAAGTLQNRRQRYLPTSVVHQSWQTLRCLIDTLSKYCQKASDCTDKSEFSSSLVHIRRLIMKLKAKVSLLAGALALAGVVYMPTAAAALLTPPTTVNIGQSLTSSGAFTTDYLFGVTGTAKASSTGSASSSTSTLSVSGFLIGTSGVSLSSISLWDGATKLASSPATSTGSGSSTFPGGYVLSGTTYSATLNYLPLLTGHTYDIKVSGTNLNSSGGAYAGTLTVNAVPEPEEWAMMLVGAGLVSYQVRRKQKGLSQSTLA